ncbi:MAG: hypothetical protein P8O75_03970 [Gammaproteobacteria bacterium]|nr:hypothetical protein [Gammaproteobacteria bacterium]
MTKITDFDAVETQQVQSHIDQRWPDEVIIIEIADVELELNEISTESASYPTVVWQAEDCTFLVIKAGKEEFRGLFFYEDSEHFSTDQDYFAEINHCVITLLQTQAEFADNAPA